jgi:hypothetical protein
MGLVFKHPTDWGALRTTDGVILCPPTFCDDSPGLVESYFVMIEAALDASDVGDEGIWKSMDELVTAQLPFLSRCGQVRPIACRRGQGGWCLWQGRGAGQVAAEARVYVSLLEGTMAALVAIGSSASIGANAGTLEEVFSSFSHRGCSSDPSLVGLWSRHEQPEHLQQAPVEAEGIEFQGDGTFRTSGPPESLRGAKKLARTRRPTRRGRWLVQDGRLMLSYSDGQWAEYTYRLESMAQGMQLVLTDPGGRLRHWQSVRG